MGFPILAGIEAVRGIAGLFKRRGKAGNATKLENAIAVVSEVVDSVQKDPTSDPEALRILQDKEIEMEKQYTEQAKAALQVMNTEAASNDPLVRRARPTLMYVGYLVMLFQLIVFPCLQIKFTEFVDVQIVYWFYYMFGAGYLGYGVLRSVDKSKGIPTALSMFK